MKKVLIIIGIIIIIIVILSFVILKRSVVQNIPAETTGTQPGSLPIREAGSQPTGSDFSAQKSIHDSAIRVEDPSSPAQIKNVFGNYNNQDLKNFPDYVSAGISLDYPSANKEGELIDLNFFLRSIGANINPKVRGLVGSNYYGFYYCVNNNKQKEYGFVFDLGDEQSSKTETLTKQAHDHMLQWESYMLKDLHAILFPGANLDEKYLDQTLSFSGEQFRITQIDFPTGKKMIVYSIKGAPANRIYISTSRECVQKGIDNLFDF